MSASVQMRHEEMALSKDISLRSALQSMLSAGARGSTFDGAAVMLGDIKNLQQADDDDEDEQEEEANDGE